MEFKFQVGDLVQHRASAERAVVVSRRVESGANEYLVERGFNFVSRSATEAAHVGLWINEVSLEVATATRIPDAWVRATA